MPSVTGKYEKMFKLHNPWSDEHKYDSFANRGNAIFFGCIFAFFAIINIISIWRTVRTSPGHIPEDRDWDMFLDEDEE